MKIVLLIPILFLTLFFPAFAQLSDTTGLVNRLDIEAGGNSYEVEVVANFDVTSYEFVKEDKRLTLFLTSSLENNLGEIIIPQELISGSFSFELNDKEYLPIHRSNNDISFITLNFTGTGNQKLDIVASEVLAFGNDNTTCPSGAEPVNGECRTIPEDEINNNGGCLIATASYGSELAFQVQQLRELRDEKLLQTNVGSAFMHHFNTFYYSFSPTIADYERENLVFREFVKLGITPMITSLSILHNIDMDSESKVLGYGISVILLNVGMYVIIPTSIAFAIKKLWYLNNPGHSSTELSQISNLQKFYNIN